MSLIALWPFICGCLLCFCVLYIFSPGYKLHDYKRSFVHCGISSREHHAGHTADSQMLWNPFLPFLGSSPWQTLLESCTTIFVTCCFNWIGVCTVGELHNKGVSEYTHALNGFSHGLIHWWCTYEMEGGSHWHSWHLQGQWSIIWSQWFWHQKCSKSSCSCCGLDHKLGTRLPGFKSQLHFNSPSLQ